MLYNWDRTKHYMVLNGTLVRLALGVIKLGAPASIDWIIAMVLAVALGRVLDHATVARILSSGFEMVWTTARRVSRVARGGELVLEAELRNRGSDDARAVSLRPIVSSMLSAEMDPQAIELPAGSSVRLDVRIKANRIGRWGVHGVALEVRGTPG